MRVADGQPGFVRVKVRVGYVQHADAEAEDKPACRNRTENTTAKSKSSFGCWHAHIYTAAWCARSLLWLWVRCALLRNHLLSVPHEHVANSSGVDHAPRQIKYWRVDFRIARLWAVGISAGSEYKHLLWSFNTFSDVVKVIIFSVQSATSVLDSLNQIKDTFWKCRPLRAKATP